MYEIVLSLFLIFILIIIASSLCLKFNNRSPIPKQVDTKVNPSYNGCNMKPSGRLEIDINTRRVEANPRNINVSPQHSHCNTSSGIYECSSIGSTECDQPYLTDHRSMSVPSQTISTAVNLSYHTHTVPATNLSYHTHTVPATNHGYENITIDKGSCASWVKESKHTFRHSSYNRTTSPADEQTEDCRVSYQRVTGRIPEQPVLTGRITEQLVLTGRIPEQLVLTGRIPEQLVLTGRIPEQLVLTGRIPEQLVLTGRIPEQLVLTGRIPEQPVLTGRIPEQPVLQHSYVNFQIHKPPGSLPDEEKITQKESSYEQHEWLNDQGKIRSHSYVNMLFQDGKNATLSVRDDHKWCSLNQLELDGMQDNITPFKTYKQDDDKRGVNLYSLV